MKMVKYWLRLTVILAVSIGCSYGTVIYAAPSTDTLSKNRADLITIDSMAVFGPLEKSAVEFLHDAHTEALARKGKDCTICHLTKNNQVYPKFKRFEDTNRKEVMNLYHQECIACHGEMKLAKEKTGPVECGNCHTDNAKYTSIRQPMGFDQSLHHRHSANNNNKCETCHHAYNEDQKKLYYEKGKEGTCRYCHQDKTEANRISMRQASHLACINCHANPPVQPQNKPPLTCAGCHDPAEQKKIVTLTDIPRMKRNQPDIVLLQTASKSPKPDKIKPQMQLVPFNHEAHERANDNCRVCHHAGMQRCGECHTVFGDNSRSKDNRAASLERAMHKTNANHSCLGCHTVSTQDRNCAGCHAFISPARKQQKATCIKCHAIPVQDIRPTATPEEKITLARSALQSKKSSVNTYRQEDIPEKVTIRKLSKEYEAVELPHRQIVNALAAGIKDNPLAGFFHNGTDTVCQGCHHHSPPSSKPPQCSNCHLDQWNPATPSKPGIIAAYHQQCMGCHTRMNIEKPAECIDCHKLKNQG